MQRQDRRDDLLLEFDLRMDQDVHKIEFVKYIDRMRLSGASQ